MDWEIKERDLKELLERWRSKKEKIEREVEYSRPNKAGQKLRKIRFLVESLKEMLSSQEEVKSFLSSLNKGSLRLGPTYLTYFLDRYFMKARLVSSHFKPRTQFKEKEPNFQNPSFRNFLASRLIAKKLTEWMDREFGGVQRFSRDAATKSLIFKLKSIPSDFNKGWAIIRCDFKSYTQNIKREKLFDFMESRGVPENILTSIRGYFSSGSYVSRLMDHRTVESFFRRLGGFEYGHYVMDPDFRSVVNADGILPGSPLSNALGLIYLADFDSWARDFVGDGGLYIRYFDDFVFVTRNGDVKSLIEKVRDIYDLKSKKGVKNILKYRKYGLSKVEFDFLGYMFKLADGELKIGIRYKTLKKFIQKYLIDYSTFKRSMDSRVKYLIAKSYYLHRWVSSFIWINDLRVLDELYMKFILPDLHRSCYAVYGPKSYMERLKGIKGFFKPTLIYRILRSAEKKDDVLVERLKRLKEILCVNS